MAAPNPPCIYVLAGPNGGGKSSIMGAMMLQAGADYFNPDLEARIQSEQIGISREEANSIAWRRGRDLLQRVIRERKTFAFETTLGGKTITSSLQEALSAGLEVRIWYVCLATPELHIERVRSRVAQGGHTIPEDRIRARFDRSRKNLVRLLPKVTELRIFDNSIEADPRSGKKPRPKLILHLRKGLIVSVCDPTETPEWAKPIVAAAMRLRP
jgi:predicted ABC-type ATPase